MHEKRAQEALIQARDYKKKGDVKTAMFHLKRSKMAQAQVTKMYNMQETVQAQVDAIQSMAMNKEHLGVMGTAADVMKLAQEEVNVEKLDEVREKFDDAMDTHVEIEQALGESWVRGGPDETDLLAELDAMGEADLTENLVVAPSTSVAAASGAGAVAAPAPAPVPLPDMPAAPTGRVDLPAAASHAAPGRVAVAAGGAGMDMMAELAGLE